MGNPLDTTETTGTSGGSQGCGSRLNGFVQLVLSTLISGFIFLLGIGIVSISPLVYDALRPSGNIANQSILGTIHDWVALGLTLLIDFTSYLLIILGPVIILASVIVFIICLFSTPSYANAV